MTAVGGRRMGSPETQLGMFLLRQSRRNGIVLGFAEPEVFTVQSPPPPISTICYLVTLDTPYELISSFLMYPIYLSIAWINTR